MTDKETPPAPPVWNTWAVIDANGNSDPSPPTRSAGARPGWEPGLLRR